MDVIVASMNQPKYEAAVWGFREVFPGASFSFRAVPAKSGVSDHPTTSEESLQGAINRVESARVMEPDADYYVGIEGGLMRNGRRAWEIGWVAIGNHTGDIATATSAGLEIKGEILEAILGGEELNSVLERLYGLDKLGDGQGFTGLVTNGRLNRERSYRQAVVFALSQFVNPQYFR